ncbi:motile sperm domain-containing protein 2 isoform X2 [Amborella trichopoda]|uniref:motile sperm domain-containing protein 2 isoform X2 n=1 Tax=Amborella trichopoda TaxID=13333 RepID=UPI0009BD8F08|nr:motile sperm domain-containing protein 2 isoform X2 [Amborella trichopoda]|eukprot:XP_020520871.1 motile sperm domain-containing protein 2 isoform X2 [Amborella trichopoda]
MCGCNGNFLLSSMAVCLLSLPFRHVTFSPLHSNSYGNYRYRKTRQICKAFSKNHLSLDLLEQSKMWRQEFRVSNISEETVKDITSTGKAYLHDYPDLNGRPVLVVVAAKHIPAKHDLTESEKLCIYLIEKAMERLSTEEGNILGIFDLRGFGTENADLAFMKFLIDVFYYYYPRRLGEVLFVDAPFLFKPFWQIVKPLLKSYANLVRFCKPETVREYFSPPTAPPGF